jgi:ribosomal protein L37E
LPGLLLWVDRDSRSSKWLGGVGCVHYPGLRDERELEMQRMACPRCGTTVDLRARRGVCPNCGFALARMMSRRWSWRAVLCLLVTVLGLVIWLGSLLFLPNALIPALSPLTTILGLGLFFVGMAGTALSSARSTTYRKYYDPNYGLE